MSEVTIVLPNMRPAAKRSCGGMLGKVVHIPHMQFGIMILATVLFCAVLAYWIARFDPEEVNSSCLLSDTNTTHLLSSEQLGGDTLSHLINGFTIFAFGQAFNVPAAPCEKSLIRGFTASTTEES